MADSQGRNFSSCRLIGLAGVLTVIVGSILLCGCGGAFIHIPSMAVVFGITFFGLLATFGTDFLRFIPQSILTFVSSNPKPNPRFAEIALFASRYIIGAGLIGMVIGLVSMLRNLSDPSGIRAGMAVALLTTFYAIIISEIFCAFLYKTYSDGDESAGKPLPLANAATAATVTALTMVLFFVLLTSFANFS